MSSGPGGAPLKSMILAAGLGTRLKPATDRTPKPLVRVAGRPMIEYPIALLRHHGVREAVVNLHHLAEQVRESLGDGSRYGVRFLYSLETEILGTAGGIRRARELLGSEPFYVVNCDVLADIDLAALRRFHDTSGAVASLVLRADPDAASFGEIGIDEEGRVRDFLGATGWSGGRLRKLMFTGVSLLDPRIHDWIPPGRKVELAAATYPRMIRAGERVMGFVHEGYWMDLGDPARLKRAEDDMGSGRARLSFLEDEG